MPIYEYQCSSCGHEFEHLQKISDPNVEICPQCSEKSVQRLVSASGFQLKGTGWYETDFKNSGKKTTEQTSQKAGTEGNGQAKKTTETT